MQYTETVHILRKFLRQSYQVVYFYIRRSHAPKRIGIIDKIFVNHTNYIIHIIQLFIKLVIKYIQ